MRCWICGYAKGNDRGTQYRSGIYFTDDEQKALAEASKEDFQVRIPASRTIDTHFVMHVCACRDEESVPPYLDNDCVKSPFTV